eukprot:179485-Chlamydomonas_euryale.AAC.4
MHADAPALSRAWGRQCRRADRQRSAAGSTAWRPRRCECGMHGRGNRTTWVGSRRKHQVHRAEVRCRTRRAEARVAQSTQHGAALRSPACLGASLAHSPHGAAKTRHGRFHSMPNHMRGRPSVPRRCAHRLARRLTYGTCHAALTSQHVWA